MVDCSQYTMSPLSKILKEKLKKDDNLATPAISKCYISFNEVMDLLYIVYSEDSTNAPHDDTKSLFSCRYSYIRTASVILEI